MNRKVKLFAIPLNRDYVLCFKTKMMFSRKISKLISFFRRLRYKIFSRNKIQYLKNGVSFHDYDSISSHIFINLDFYMMEFNE